MASSSYYYEQYKIKKDEAVKYGRNINDLDKIHGNLVDDMYDEIRNINNELDALKEDLNKSVRYNAAYTARANGFLDKKEMGVGADEKLRETKADLEYEISRLNGLKQQAEADRDNYYRSYLEEKQREREAEERARQEWLNKLKEGLGL